MTRFFNVLFFMENSSNIYKQNDFIVTKNKHDKVVVTIFLR